MKNRTNNYRNDLGGNTLAGGGRTNTWDSRNRLTQCVYNGTTSSYVFGADGLRRRATVNGTVTDFALDGQFIVEEGQAANGMLTPTATFKHAFVGQLGHPSEDETGLIYMRARYYDPAAGRFVSDDPGRAGVNWFVYVPANPTTDVVPTGAAGLPDTLIATQQSAELDETAATGLDIDDMLVTKNIIRGKRLPDWLSRYVERKLRFDGNSAQSRHALGEAIGGFKEGFGRGGADNIGISKNAVFIVGPNGQIIGFVSDILAQVVMDG